MNPSRLFILRPVATTLLMVAVLLAGIIGYRALPVSALPQVDYPTIQVVTLYPGASPEVTAATITAPLERQFGQMPGLKQMSSQSSGGASVIVLQFNLELHLDVAEQEVQAAINAANTLLPDDLPNPPIYSKVNPADPPILTLAVTSKTLPMTQVQDLVETRLSQKLSQVSGVGLVTLSGGQRPAVRVQLNPRAMAAYGLSSDAVRTAISSANVSQAKGSFDGPTRASTISANDQLQTAEDYRNLIVAYRNGAPVRLSDVAEVVDGAENARLAAWSGREAAIIVNVQRQPGANVIETVDRIRELLPRLESALPAAVEVTVLTDRTATIRAAITDVKIELLLAVALVVMVIFVFLRNLRATIIPSIAVPLSLVGTFGVMYLAGFSVNNLTLMALTIATGFVVDDAIVVVENIARYIEKGERPLDAALKGAGEIGFTIISLTVSLVAVLIPLLFMGDVVGRLFREFAITLAVAILISAVVSLTLTPMMCARLLHQGGEAEGAVASATHRFFDRLIAGYGRTLGWVLNHQRTTLGVALGMLALTLVLFAVIPKGFFPLQDNGVIQVITEAPQTVSFEAMARRQQELADLILSDEDVETVASFIGVDGANAALNVGRMQITLKPLEERDARAPEIIRRLQAKVANVPGVSVYMQPVQDLTTETTLSRTQYQFTLQAPSLSELSQWVPKLVQRLRSEPVLADVASDLQDQGLVTYVHIDRATASRLGISVAAIDAALYDAFGQRLISTIFTQANQYRVVLSVDPEHAKGPGALSGIYLTASATGSGTVPATVPLTSVARIEERTGPLVIGRLGQFPAATVSFNLAPGASLGEAVEAIRAAEREIGMPASIMTDFQGAALAFEAALGNEMWLIVAAVVAMYIVLGVLYESFIHPVTILSTLPTAAVGALLALDLSGHDLSVIAIIGIILLIGIVKKNAIMMIDFALVAERERGLPPRQAIFEASLLRFRPILMTTMAALLGALPLMLSVGVGAELRRPLGIAMVGGLVFSQVLTLYTTPVIYLAFDRLARRFKA